MYAQSKNSGSIFVSASSFHESQLRLLSCKHAERARKDLQQNTNNIRWSDCHDNQKIQFVHKENNVRSPKKRETSGGVVRHNAIVTGLWPCHSNRSIQFLPQRKQHVIIRKREVEG
jgi:hypothetical protein